MRALFCLLAVCVLAFGQEPLPFQMLPPDSAAIVGVNIGGIRSSKLGQSLFEQLTKTQGFAKLKAEGFDPLREVHEVLFAAPGSRQRNRGFFLVRGECSDAQLRRYAGKGQATESTFRGSKILTATSDNGQRMSLACADQAMLMGGDPESVKAGILRKGSPKGPDPLLLEQAARLRAANDVWLISKADLANLAADMPGSTNKQAAAWLNSPMLKSIQQISMGLKLSAGLDLALDLTAKTGNDAEMMAGGLMMFAGMVKSDPKAKEFASFLDHLNVRAEGTTMQLRLALTEDQIALIAARAKTGFRTAGASPGEVTIQSSPSTGEVKVYSSDKDMGVVTLPAPK